MGRQCTSSSTVITWSPLNLTKSSSFKTASIARLLSVSTLLVLAQARVKFTSIARLICATTLLKIVDARGCAKFVSADQLQNPTPHSRLDPSQSAIKTTLFPYFPAITDYACV